MQHLWLDQARPSPNWLEFSSNRLLLFGRRRIIIGELLDVLFEIANPPPYSTLLAVRFTLILIL